MTPHEGPGFPNPVPQPQGRTRSVQQSSLPLPSDHGIPTSVAFTSTEPAHIVASFRSGDTVLYDLEAGSALLSLESRGSSGKREALGSRAGILVPPRLQSLLWLW